MALTNEQVLTRGDRKYAAKKRTKQAAEVSFDESARADFLTGFHKRKLERREKARAKAAELNRQQRLAERRKIREERKQKIGDVPTLAREIAQVSELEKLNAGELLESLAEPENSATAQVANGNDEEFTGFTDGSGILKKHSRYGDTDVLVEEIELDPFVDVSRSEQVLEEATRKAHDYAAYVEGLESRQAVQERKKKKKRKFKYSVPKRNFRN